MSILITGGAGFIGANLVHALLEQKYLIHVITDPSASLPSASLGTNLWRLKPILKDIIVHEVDLADFEKVTKLVRAIKPSTIYHLASYGGFHFQNDQKTIYNVNFDGTLNLLNACKQVGFDCFINTGSSSEYGMKNEPMRESSVLEPITDYAVAKAAATQYCLKEALFNKLPVYTVRPFAVYGDYELNVRLIPTIMVNALQDKPLPLGSSPFFVRDYIYIHDMVSILMAVAAKKPTNAFVFNAGTGKQSTIQDVLDTVQKFVPTPLRVTWGMHTPRPWEPAMWQADMTQAKTILDWQPMYSLEQGIHNSITWFKNNLHLYTQDENGKPYITSTTRTTAP